MLSLEYSLYRPSAAGWPHSMHKLWPFPPWTVTAGAGGGEAGGGVGEEAARAAWEDAGVAADRGMRSNGFQTSLYKCGE